MNIELFDVVLTVLILGAFVVSLIGLRRVIQEEFLGKWNMAVGTIFGLLFISYLIYNVILHKIEPTGWAQIFLTLGLTMATGLYALVAFRQARASVKMAEEMRNSRSPSITIRWGSADPNKKRISAYLKNEGFGPAFNLEWYLTGKALKFNRNPILYTTFEVGQEYTLTLPSENFDFKAWNGLAINCDYGSAFGGKFRSILRCDSEKERSFEIVKLK